MKKLVVALSAIALALGACAHSADSANQPGADKSPQAARTDSDMQAVLDAHAALGPKPMEKLDPKQARAQPTPADAVMAVLKAQKRGTAPSDLVPGVTHADRSIPGAAGSIPARVYTPAGSGPFPVIVYFHGGGWVIGNKEVYDGGARGISKQANAIVISVDYRLAPENKFPASWDDSFAAYQWALQNAASLKGDPKRMALAGESAGGGLALATAIAARDAKVQMPLHVLSVYPIAQTSTDTASYNEHAMAKPLNKAMMQWFFGHASRNPNDFKDPRMNLVGANLSGLPPVTIINAQIDPLLNDSVMLEAALKKAGVQVERREYAGVTHEFFGMAAVVKDAQEAQSFAGQRLRKAFGS